MKAIDALKRLERAGSEYSRTTKKLHDAARTMADLIASQVPRGEELPRGYRVEHRRSNVGSCDFLADANGDYVDAGPHGFYLHGDFHSWIPGTGRPVVLRFAADIATGLLDEISSWLEEGAERNRQDTSVLSQNPNQEGGR